MQAHYPNLQVAIMHVLNCIKPALVWTNLITRVWTFYYMKTDTNHSIKVQAFSPLINPICTLPDLQLSLFFISAVVTLYEQEKGIF